jgi:hypothetical protein
MIHDLQNERHDFLTTKIIWNVHLDYIFNINFFIIKMNYISLDSIKLDIMYLVLLVLILK